MSTSISNLIERKDVKENTETASPVNPVAIGQGTHTELLSDSDISKFSSERGNHT